MTIEDEWVDWEGIETPGAKIDVIATYAIPSWDPRYAVTEVSKSHKFRADHIAAGFDHFFAGDALHTAEEALRVASSAHNTLYALFLACANNKFNEHTGELSADDVMLKWLEKAGEVVE